LVTRNINGIIMAKRHYVAPSSRASGGRPKDIVSSGDEAAIFFVVSLNTHFECGIRCLPGFGDRADPWREKHQGNGPSRRDENPEKKGDYRNCDHRRSP
jgi:hypothetical protein